MGGRKKLHSNKTNQEGLPSSSGNQNRSNNAMRGVGGLNSTSGLNSGFPPSTGFQAASSMEMLQETTAARIRRVALSLERSIENQARGEEIVDTSNIDPKFLPHPSTGPVTRELLEVIAEYQRASGQHAPVNRRLEMEQPEKPTSWSSVVAGSKLAGKGVPLSFIAPVIKDGKKVIKLQPSELDKLNEHWQQSIVLYVVGYTPTIASLSKYVAANWSYVSMPKIFLHDDGYFVVKFMSMDDKNAVLADGPHLFFGKAMIIKPWKANFDFCEEILRVIPIWVKFPNLPLNCWSSDSLSRIGSSLGVPLFADACTTRQDRISFARVLIEMDVTLALPDCVWIEDELGKLMKQQVVYDWTPPFCKSCNKVGHDCAKTAPVKPKQVVKPKRVWVQKKVQPVNPVTAAAQVVTPCNQGLPTPDSNTGWKVVTRKTQSKGGGTAVGVENSFAVLEQESDEDLSDCEGDENVGNGVVGFGKDPPNP